MLKSSHTGHSEADKSAIRTGYLMSRYPAVSHTFLLKEVVGLRERGLIIETASINLPDRRSEDLSDIERMETQRTFYVKRRNMLTALFEALMIALRHPIVAFRGLGYALTLGKWSLEAQVFALFYLAEALLVGNWMRNRSLEHLHVHFGGPVGSVGLVTAKAWQVPLSFTLHGPDEFFDQEASWLRQKIETASFVICISDFCSSQVLRIAPNVSEDRLEVVRLGVDCLKLVPRQRSLDSAADSKSVPVRLVCTGRMVAAKGHRILLKALAGMVSAGDEVSLVLVGDGPERAALEQLAAQSRITDKVRFLGAMSHQATLDEVAQADIFVLASFAEGLPVALMEAMALGVPCVSTPIAAIPEMIHDGKNGLLAPAANVPALQAALEKLAKAPELRRQLGLTARATVETEYNLAVNLDRLARVWRTRLAKP